MLERTSLPLVLITLIIVPSPGSNGISVTTDAMDWYEPESLAGGQRSRSSLGAAARLGRGAFRELREKGIGVQRDGIKMCGMWSSPLAAAPSALYYSSASERSLQKPR